MTLEEMLVRLPRMPKVGDHEIARHEDEATFHLMIVTAVYSNDVREGRPGKPVVTFMSKCGSAPVAHTSKWTVAPRGQGITCLLCTT